MVSSAISIRNNWNVVLENYGLPYLFVQKPGDLKRIQPGYFVLFTLNMVSTHKKLLRGYLKRIRWNIQLVLDESDEISNPGSARSQAVLYDQFFHISDKPAKPILFIFVCISLYWFIVDIAIAILYPISIALFQCGF